MKFWEALNDLLAGGGHQSPESDVNASLWGNLADQTRNAQSASDGDIFNGISNLDARAPAPSTPSPYDVSVDELNTIAREGKRGLQIVDIDAYQTSSVDNKCLIQPDVLMSLFGYDPTVQGSAGFSVFFVSTWRTVRINSSGNFLKIEKLPPRTSWFDVGNATSQAPGPLSGQLTSRSYTRDGTSYPPSPRPFNEISGPERQFAATAVILQFDSPSSPPHLAKSGEVYKQPFQTVFITFRQSSARWRVTSGYNSEIQNNDNQGNANMNLALGPGGGIWNNPTRLPVPFSTRSEIHDSTNNPVSYLNPPDVINFSTFAAAQGFHEIVVIDQSQTLTTTAAPIQSFNPVQNGVAILWLTSINAYIQSNTANTGLCSIAIYKKKTWSGVTTTSLVKNYWSTVSVSEANSITPSSFNGINFNFSTPIRIVLDPDEKLIVKVTAQTTAATGVKATAAYFWALNGYVLGGFAGLGNTTAGGSVLPLPGPQQGEDGNISGTNIQSSVNAYWCYTFDENQFPDDYPWSLNV